MSRCWRPQDPGTGTRHKPSPRPGRGDSPHRGQPRHSGTGPAFGRPPARAPTPRPSLSGQPGAAQARVGSRRPRPAHEHQLSSPERGAFPELRSLPAKAEVVRTDVSGLRCCSPGRTLASPAGSGTEPRGVASGGPTAGEPELSGEPPSEPRADGGGVAAAAAIRRRGGQPRGGPPSGPRRAYCSGAALREAGQKPKGSYGGLRGRWRLFGQPVPCSEGPEAAAGASAGAASPPPGVAIETGWLAQQRFPGWVGGRPARGVNPRLGGLSSERTRPSPPPSLG